MKKTMNLQLFADSPITGVKKLVYAIMTDEENFTKTETVMVCISN